MDTSLRVKNLLSRILVIFLILTIGIPLQTVHAEKGTGDPSVLDDSTAGPVANDDFDDAIVIYTASYSTTINTSGATTAADDPLFTCGMPGSQLHYTVWFRYTPLTDGVLTVSTIGTVGVDTVLAIWTGERGTLTSQGCNDDYPPSTTSLVQIPVSEGVTYHIEAAGFSNASYGNLKFNLSSTVSIVSPTPIAPTGTVNGQSRPTFQWTVYPGATSYRLAVYQSSVSSYVILDNIPSTMCNALQCLYVPSTHISDGNYKWKVLANTPSGPTPYSGFLTFTIAGVILPPPTTAPTAISPSGTVNTHAPTFKWSPVTYATAYYLVVYSNASATYVVKTNVYLSCSATMCAFTPSTWDLPNGSYKFKVLAKNNWGLSPYSAFKNFTVSSNLPVMPKLLGPSGTVSANPPQFSWNTVSGATKYRLAVYSNVTKSYIILTNILPTACSGSVCTYTPSSALASGSYKFKMLTGNTYGISGYTAFMNFTVP